MFVDAIEKAKHFTRAIHTIVRNYDSAVIQPGAATLFFVNADGWAITARHVAHMIVASDAIGKRREAFRQNLQRKQVRPKLAKLRRELETKHGSHVRSHSRSQ